MRIDEIEIVHKKTDILIIGGGAAGCQAAIRAKEIDGSIKIIIAEKAHIDRSGCLAAGVNAINAYITEGETPESYVKYVKKDSSGLIREDLTLSIGKRLNRMAEKLEEYGLPYLKDENGKYLARAKRSIKINGEAIKPILAKATIKSGAEVINRINITNYIIKNGRVFGAYGFSVREKKFYILEAKAVIIATGGASGIYKPNNGGDARHKMWYSPFNTGAGLAMGIRAGAEMTTFEMRFIALRTKDTLSPTGTIAQGVSAPQINGKNEKYMDFYENKSTPMRLWATIQENLKGNGPCYLDITKVTDADNIKIKEAYLNMSPSIVLKWADEKIEPNKKPVEIYGSEPFINGGHGQAGYWVDDNRRTTIEGLYAAGDIAGGSPKKYVTGAMAEGEIAVEDAINQIKKIGNIEEIDYNSELKRVFYPIMNLNKNAITWREAEERMQKIMDEYAGGISQNYGTNEKKLLEAKIRIDELEEDLKRITVSDMHELMNYHEVEERVLVAKVLIEHMLYRKETRWKCYQERLDYPNMDNENWMKFVNSVYRNGKVEIIERDFKEVIK